MDQDSDRVKDAAREKSDRLAELGRELDEIRFSYRVEERASRDYWQKRIRDFKRHSGKAMEYYDQARSMMRLVSEEDARLFLLRASKFRQLGLALIDVMEKISENPSIIDPKDRQQSQWSRGIKSRLAETSDRCLRHEREMNAVFRKFYEERLKFLE